VEPAQTPAQMFTPELLRYLRSMSRTSLLSFRLAKQAELADMRRDLVVLLDQLVTLEATVALADLFIYPPQAVPALCSAASAVASALDARPSSRARRGGPRPSAAP